MDSDCKSKGPDVAPMTKKQKLASYSFMDNIEMTPQLYTAGSAKCTANISVVKITLFNCVRVSTVISL